MTVKELKALVEDDDSRVHFTEINEGCTCSWEDIPDDTEIIKLIPVARGTVLTLVTIDAYVDLKIKSIKLRQYIDTINVNDFEKWYIKFYNEHLGPKRGCIYGYTNDENFAIGKTKYIENIKDLPNFILDLVVIRIKTHCEGKIEFYVEDNYNKAYAKLIKDSDE